ncbi:MAG: SDR family NAD(P)-dependent oxidoreductase [Sedimentitalea sp.]
MTNLRDKNLHDQDIAIVGMSVCVPGATSAQAFWQNLAAGVESIQRLDEQALLDAGERPDLIANPDYVPAAAVLDGFDTFDADFFGFSPKEAAILDPQHRKFLETAWEALEHAGHTPESSDGPIGVFAGCGMGSYFYFNICSNPGLVDDVGMFLLRHTGNDKDFLSTRVSHVFDLKGPSINLQTACSTSLVAVHYACKALRDGDCKMALAGGVTIELPQNRGYLFKENEILSPDGHCHAFDHRAQGTVFGSGAGTVVLRPLADALADGDQIWAVIKGSAVNNDGAAKAGYLAPSVDGQASAIAQALANADVAADTVDYVECHGTGTYLGDPIEVSALSEAYRASTDDVGYCRIGSVKTNIGHLDTAAGVAGLVKTTMALHHKQIPPSLGYEAPNPAIDFETSPFRVNDSLTDWTSHKGPRRAGVNALGVGGTNAHVVLQEAPARTASDESDFPFHALCLSARSKSALEDNTKALAAHLRANPDLNLADVAFTLKNGRRGFDKRRVVVAEDALQAAELLESGDARQMFSHDKVGDAPEVVFMFPGGGAQYPGMARDLYETEPVFAEWMDRGLDHLQPKLDFDLRALWLPKPEDMERAGDILTKPSVQLPLIMIVEYALAQLWQSWGVRPGALVGHSMGENTAACLAGVLGFEDCIDLVLLRGRLFDTVPAGGMLSISLPVAEVRALIGDDLDIASVNAPNLTAVSGAQSALDALSQTLIKRDIDHQRIAIDIAAHSRMLDPILDEFGAFLRSITLSAPTLPVMSNRSGAVLSDEQATDPDYWVAQLRNTVHFADCIETLGQRENRVYLEVGPGKALSSLSQMCPGVKPNQVLSSLRHPDQDVADDAFFIGVIGRLWATGVEADWDQIWGEARRHRLPLPTYAFQRSRYFIEPGAAGAQAVVDPLPMRLEDMAEWGYRPTWRPALANCPVDVDTELDLATRETWLIFEDEIGYGARAADRLEQAGHTVTRVRSGDTFGQLKPGHYVVSAEQGRDGYDQLIADLTAQERFPTRVGHFWLMTEQETFRPGSSFADRNMEHGFFSLMALAQALSATDLDHPVHINVFTTGAAQVRDEALPYPEKATIAGPVGVIPRELPGFSCSSLDIAVPKPLRDGTFASMLRPTRPAQDDTIDLVILEELLGEPDAATAAWRAGKRFERSFRAFAFEPASQPVLKNGGTYILTGGFGGIGLSVARDLMTRYKANIVLVSRNGLPVRDDWDQVIAQRGPRDVTRARILAVQDLEKLEGTILVAPGDVCNLEDMRAVADATRAQFGTINGVFHGAGTIQDGPILTKSAADVAQVFAPKITGLRVLDSVFPDGTLDLMVLFSSSSTATRPAGQIDYVAANEYLNAFAKSRQNSATKVVSVNWGVWGDVGMAAEALAHRQGIAAPTPPEPAQQPLLDERGFDAHGNPVFFAHYDAQKDWIFNEHRTKTGQALLPGTGYIELAAQALAQQGVPGPFQLRDLYFFRPLLAQDAQATDVVVRLEPSDDGFDFSVHTRVEAGYQLNAQARLELGAFAAQAPANLSSIAERCSKISQETDGDRLMSPQEAHLAFGPRWHVLQERAFGDGEALAKLALPTDMRGDLDQGYLVHPALMDLATGWAINLAPSYDGASLWVPVSYGDIRIFAPLPAQISSWVRLSQEDAATDGFVAFDITLFAPDGAVLAEISGFRMKRMEGAFELTEDSVADATSAELGLDRDASALPLSADEQRLAHNISQGITAAEGPAALERALAQSGAQIIVSSLDLNALITQADRSTAAPADEGQSFERPDLDTDYAPPETEIEKSLAKMWEALLGVAQVGIHDSFFDLGGHSLIAVRLFAQIKGAFGVEFPISVLFEAPSVAKCAAMIAQRTGADVALGDGETPQVASVVRKHLVTLHPNPGASKRPFFLVAGMFGNVLNLRHLALMLGRERPVYGLQARGLIGDDAPHTNMQEAAADYIAELRSIQPEGPYLLGGFSGGGITAYEMARQLEAEGEEIAQLVLLDTPLPVRPELNARDKAMIKVQEMREKGLRFFGEWAGNRIRWEIEKRRNPGLSELSQTPVFNNQKIEAAFRTALIGYDLQPWDGPVALFRPQLDRHWKVSGGQWVSTEREYVYPDNAWTAWAPRTEVIEVPGDHDSMVLAPNVSVLAARLKQVIETSERAKAPAPQADWLRATAAE